MLQAIEKRVGPGERYAFTSTCSSYRLNFR
jgi:hypothetical protein